MKISYYKVVISELIVIDLWCKLVVIKSKNVLDEPIFG